MLVALPLAMANLLYFHYATCRSVAEWDMELPPPFPVRMAGVLSIVLWLAVLCSGRLVAYDWWTIVENVR